MHARYLFPAVRHARRARCAIVVSLLRGLLERPQRAVSPMGVWSSDLFWLSVAASEPSNMRWHKNKSIFISRVAVG